MASSIQATLVPPPAETVVLLPFASGRVAEVELSCYPGEQGGRPVTAYPVYDGVGPDLVKTVDYAAEVAYRLARETATLCSTTFYIGYRLKDLPAEAKVSGESAGLAMAISTYCKLTSLSAGRIAATGRLKSFDKGGEIDRVDGLPAKLQGVLQVLSGGDTMFYPRANDANIPASVRAAFTERGILLIPVGSVREALSHLGVKGSDEIPAKTPARRKLSPLVVLLGLLGCMVLTGTVCWQLIKGKAQWHEPVAQSESESQRHPAQLQVNAPEAQNELEENLEATVSKKAQEHKPAPMVVSAAEKRVDSFSPAGRPVERVPVSPQFSRGFE